MQNNAKHTIYENSTVKRALSGGANINALDAFKRANELTKSSFSVMAAASAIVLIIVMLVLIVSFNILGVPITEYQNVAATQRAVIDIVLVLVLSPLMAGLLMMGVDKARGHTPHVMHLFNWVKIAVVLALGSLIASLLMQLGISLFIVPGLYIAIATTFTLTLIADKKTQCIDCDCSIGPCGQSLLGPIHHIFLNFYFIIYDRWINSVSGWYLADPLIL
jgi:hypothetical protein